MARFIVHLHVMPRSGVADPPGEATRSALLALGFDEVAGVRIGRRIEVELDAPDEAHARERVRAMAERLLANPVVEEYELAPPVRVDATAARPEAAPGRADGGEGWKA